MGAQKDIEFVYDDLDERWRSSIGEHADISAAFFNGDFGKSLEQAQRDKHEWILEGIGFRPGHRIIDIGCGWGPILKSVKDKGGNGIGITLSPKQVEACKRSGLDARLLDWKNVDPKKLGKFDGVISVGAFEHFCSVEEHLEGKRDQVYEDFFKFCSDLLPDNGTLYLQTMTWGKYLPWGDREPTREDIGRCSFKAPKKSDERVLAGVRAFFPGSWVPRNAEHIANVAKPYFELIEANDGRLDYVKTTTEWEKMWFAPQALLIKDRIKILWKYIFAGGEYRKKLECLRNNCIREVFIRNLFGHQRMFLRKKK